MIGFLVIGVISICLFASRQEIIDRSRSFVDNPLVAVQTLIVIILVALLVGFRIIFVRNKFGLYYKKNQTKDLPEKSKILKSYEIVLLVTGFCYGIYFFILGLIFFIQPDVGSNNALDNVFTFFGSLIGSTPSEGTT